MSSTRLPGKVLKDIAGKPMLWHVITRLKRAKSLNNIIVAISDNPADDPIVDLLDDMKVNYYRGSENDVLDRYYRAATLFGTVRTHETISTNETVIVRITSDCPLIDLKMVDKTVKYFLNSGCDYVSFGDIRQPISTVYPDGFDIEVFSFDALRQAWMSETINREHVTTYIIENLRTGFVPYDSGLRQPIRLSVDTGSDLTLIRWIFANLGNRFGIRDVLRLLKEKNEF